MAQEELKDGKAGQPRVPSVLCLDFEATLVSNIVSLFVRPHLAEFLEACRELFPRMAIFTTVREERFREAAKILVDECAVPAWFEDIEYIQWHGRVKDLGFVPNALPADVLLVDDMQLYIHPDQLDQWIRIDGYEPPFERADDELLRVLGELRRRTALSG